MRYTLQAYELVKAYKVVFFGVQTFELRQTEDRRRVTAKPHKASTLYPAHRWFPQRFPR